MKVSITSLIYQSTDFAEFVYNSVVKHTPMIGTGEAEFFFVANDATDEVIEFLREKKYPFYVNNNPHYTEAELFSKGYARPEYINRVYAGYNFAIKMCKSDLVVLINSDMAFSPNWLENLMKRMRDDVVVSPVTIQPSWFINPRNGIRCPKLLFGSTIKSFNEEAFLKKVEKILIDSESVGVIFMPVMFYKWQSELVSGYPEGNLHGGKFEIVRVTGDAFFLDKLQEKGIRHIQSNDSIIYHLNEGEKYNRVDNNVFILGAGGMLGAYLTKYLKDSIGITREYIDATQVKGDDFIGQMEAFNPQKGDTIINAIGITNKHTERSSWEFLLVNSFFPKRLADYCEDNDIQMIHITTDCVFTGTEGNYDENSLHDDNSIYGFSKSHGEPRNCTVIRTSIIGENRKSNADLLEWVRHSSGTIQGWTNHYWNGITCLQFAKICEEIIREKKFWKGVKHIYSPKSLDKCSLVETIKSIYELDVAVAPAEASQACNRTLTSIREPYFTIPTIREQIIEQKNFEL